MDKMTNLKKYRKQYGFTQQQLGDLIGVGKSTMSMYENGLYEPDIETLKKLADIFSISLDELVNRDIGSSVKPDSDLQSVAIRIAKDNDYKSLIQTANKSRPESLRIATALLESLNKGNFLGASSDNPSLSFAEPSMSPKLT